MAWQPGELSLHQRPTHTGKVCVRTEAALPQDGAGRLPVDLAAMHPAHTGHSGSDSARDVGSSAGGWGWEALGHRSPVRGPHEAMGLSQLCR